MRKTDTGVSPFWDYIGMKETHIGNGQAEIQLEVHDNLLQRRKFVHGGVLASLIDASVGSAVRSELSEEQASTTVELKINYLKPAKGNLTAKSKLTHKGNTLAYGQAEIFDDEEKLVAAGTATYMIIS